MPKIFLQHRGRARFAILIFIVSQQILASPLLAFALRQTNVRDNAGLEEELGKALDNFSSEVPKTSGLEEPRLGAAKRHASLSLLVGTLLGLSIGVRPDSLPEQIHQPRNTAPSETSKREDGFDSLLKTLEGSELNQLIFQWEQDKVLKALKGLNKIAQTKSLTDEQTKRLLNVLTKTLNFQEIDTGLDIQLMPDLPSSRIMFPVNADIRLKSIEILTRIPGTEAEILRLTTPGLGINDSDLKVAEESARILMRRGRQAIEAVANSALRHEDLRHRLLAVWTLDEIGKKEGSYDDVLTELMKPEVGLFDRSEEVVKGTASVIARIGGVKGVFAFLDGIANGNTVTRAYSQRSIKEINPILILRLIDDTIEKHKARSPIQPKDFNLLIHGTTLANELPEKKARVINVLHQLASWEPNRQRQMMYLMSIYMAVKNLNAEETAVFKRLHPDISIRLESLFTTPTLPYQEIFNKKRNPRQEFNMRLYIPLAPQDYSTMFVNDLGLTERKEGEILVYTGRLNGKMLNIYLDPRGDPKNYKGKTFEFMSDPAVHLIGYGGHTGMGASLAFALDQAPDADLLQSGNKVVVILSCASVQTYLNSITRRYPYAQFVGTLMTTSDNTDLPALRALIEGITQEKEWKDIQKAIIDAAGEKVDYLLPHDERRPEYLDLGGDGRTGVKRNQVLYVPTLGVTFLDEEDSFEFRPGNVDLSRVVSSKVTETVQKVSYFFGWNTFLKDVHQRLRPAGFTLPRADEQETVFVSERSSGAGTVYEVSINAGYRSSSRAALTMMTLYELNLYFSKLAKKDQVTPLDRLRGLQMAAEFAKTHHKESLFARFLKKYGFDEAIPLELFLKTLDDHDNATRAKALREILDRMKYSEDFKIDKLKAEGLLSFAPVSLVPSAFEKEQFSSAVGLEERGVVVARELAVAAVRGLYDAPSALVESKVLVFTDPRTFDLIPLAVRRGRAVAVNDDGPKADAVRQLLNKLPLPKGAYAIGKKATEMLLKESYNPVWIESRADVLRRLGLNPDDLPPVIQEAIEITGDYLGLFV